MVEQLILHLLLLYTPVCLAVVCDDPPHSVLELLRRLIQPEQLYPDPLPVGEELLPQQQLLHVLIYVSQVFYQDVLHDLLQLRSEQVSCRILQNHNQDVLEHEVQLLCLNGYHIDHSFPDGHTPRAVELPQQ